MDKLVLIFLLGCCMTCSTVLSQTVLDIYGGRMPRMLPQGQGLVLTCHFNIGYQVAIDYTVQWLHKPMIAGAEEVVLTQEKVLKDKDKHSNYYAGDIKIEGDSKANVTLELMNAQPWMDGKYTCRAMLKEDPNQILEKSVVVTVPANVQHLELTFDGLKIHGVMNVTVERVEGNYGVSCNASGSNPGISLQLFLGEEQLSGSLSARDGKNTWAQDAVGARRYQRTLTLNKLDLKPAHSGKILRCLARANFDGALEKVASIPLKVIALVPVVHCDRNNTGLPKDKYVSVTCRVDHQRVEVKTYTFEIVDTSEMVTQGVDSPNHHEILVQPVPGMDHVEDVSLVLYETVDMHYESGYNLHILLDNGQTFTFDVELEQRENTGGSSRIAGSILCVLLSLLLWML